MDIRTKLVFTLVAVSLASMFALGTITYSTAETLLTGSTLAQLEGLADTNKERVEGLVADWQDRTRLAATPRQLRVSLRDHNQASRGDPAARIREMLTEALEAVGSYEALAVYDLRGRLVASVRRDGSPGAEPDSLSAVPSPTGSPVLTGTSLIEGRPQVTFAAHVDLDGEPQGFLSLSLDGADLLDVTDDHGALGASGETLLVGRDGSGVARLLTPASRPLEGPQGLRLGDPATRALAGEEGQFSEGMLDYRGEPVWAATRYLPETGWGLVVKFDAEEAQSPIARFREALMDLGIALAAFAILAGIVLGLRFAKPIHDLAAVATRIRDGELDARASVTREDEIGLFARTFNDMTDELERRMTLLREFKKFFDVSLDMLCIAGTDGYFKRLNPAFQRTLGWTEEQLKEQPFNALIHPDDVEATNQEVAKLAQGIPTISFENRFRCADGSYKLFRWTSHPEPETGLLYAIARDITDLEGPT